MPYVPCLVCAAVLVSRPGVASACVACACTFCMHAMLASTTLAALRLRWASHSLRHYDAALLLPAAWLELHPALGTCATVCCMRRACSLVVACSSRGCLRRSQTPGRFIHARADAATQGLGPYDHRRRQRLTNGAGGTIVITVSGMSRGDATASTGGALHVIYEGTHAVCARQCMSIRGQHSA